MNIIKWIRDGNDCSKCPCYWFEHGYEDCDEGCSAGRDDKLFYSGCRLPFFIRWYKNRQAYFYYSHEYDGIVEWEDERNRKEMLIIEAVRKNVFDESKLTLCASAKDPTTEEPYYWAVDQDWFLYRIAHEANGALIDDKHERGENRLKKRWAVLLKDTWNRFIFRVRRILTI